MCDTCPAHIPGPGEVAGGVAGLAAGGIIAAARNRTGRRVMVGLCYVMFAGVLVYTLGWWLLPIALGLMALAAGVLRVVGILHRQVVVPAATPAQRVAELERRRRNAIPVPAARPALPRGLSITRKRRALPAPARALPAAVVEPTRIVAPAALARRSSAEGR